jgi:ABC-2 type transport system permease protein
MELHHQATRCTVVELELILGRALSSWFLLHEDLSWHGCLVALATVMALLGAVVTCGVTVSAIANSTLLGIAVLWGIICAADFLLRFLPLRHPAPDRILQRLAFILQGDYDLNTLAQFAGWSILVSCLTSLVGMAYFSRRDV